MLTVTSVPYLRSSGVQPIRRGGPPLHVPPSHHDGCTWGRESARCWRRKGECCCEQPPGEPELEHEMRMR